MQPTPNNKEERKKIEEDTKAFLERGGKITKIPFGVMKDAPKKAKKYNLDIVATRISKGESLAAIALEHGADMRTMRAGLKSHGYL